jgi:hypothetical protein
MRIKQQLISKEKPSRTEVHITSNDLDSHENIVGLFDLLLKIDRRVNSQLYHD